MVRLRVGPQGGAITLRSTPGVSCALAVSGPGAWVRHRLFQPLSGIAGAAWLFVGGPALAASTAPPVDLEWVAPRQCPGHGAVIREVSRILGDQAPPTPRRIAARAEVWRGEDTRWHAALTSAGTGSATRSLDAESCEAVANAAALILALMVDPSRATTANATPPAASASAPSAAPEAAPAPPSAPVPRDEGSPVVPPDVGPHAGPTPGERDVESEGRRPRWAIGVLGGVSVGALPAAQPGAEVAIAWLTERLRLEIAGRSDWSHQRVALASRTDEGADFRLLSGLARGCYSLSSSRLALGACAVFELNWLRASGFGATPSVNGDALIPAIGASAIATYGIGDRIAVRVLLEGVAPFSRPTFVIVRGPLESTAVDQPGAVWGQAMLGAELHFF